MIFFVAKTHKFKSNLSQTPLADLFISAKNFHLFDIYHTLPTPVTFLTFIGYTHSHKKIKKNLYVSMRQTK